MSNVLLGWPSGLSADGSQSREVVSGKRRLPAPFTREIRVGKEVLAHNLIRRSYPLDFPFVQPHGPRTETVHNTQIVAHQQDRPPTSRDLSIFPMHFF